MAKRRRTYNTKAKRRRTYKTMAKLIHAAVQKQYQYPERLALLLLYIRLASVCKKL
jgi:hypothetical protein